MPFESTLPNKDVKKHRLQFIISAPSGGGKTSLIRSLLDKDAHISSVCSHTTRTRRMAEQDGIDYWFIERPVFEQMQANGDFLEYNTNYDELYGTSKQEVEKVLASDRDALFEVDWNGACQIRQIIKDAIWIFLIPPDLQSLRRRLRYRGRENTEEIEKRLECAMYEIEQGVQNADYLVINDQFDNALEQVRSIIAARRCRRENALMLHAKLVNALLDKDPDSTPNS